MRERINLLLSNALRLKFPLSMGLLRAIAEKPLLFNLFFDNRAIAAALPEQQSRATL